MWTKRSSITALILLNTFLLSVLLLGRSWLPAAFAQAGGRHGSFVCLTAKATGQSYDVLYVLDVPDRKLHAFYPSNVQSRELAYAGFRDLKSDFGP